MEDLTFTSDGYHVTFKHAKQRGVVKVSKFLIPKAKAAQGGSNSSTCWATILGNYIDACQSDTKLKTGPLFRTARQTKFHQSPIGINTLYKVGIEVSTLLNLKNPRLYTGHCFRRTSATLAADQGASSMDMTRHFGWKSEKMALEYVDNSKVQTKKMATILQEEISSGSSVSSEDVTNNSGMSGSDFSGCNFSNCTFIMRK